MWFCSELSAPVRGSLVDCYQTRAGLFDGISCFWSLLK